MNEDITQEIYFLMVAAGIDEKKAMKLCGCNFAKRLYEKEKQKAEEFMRKNLMEDFRLLTGIKNVTN